MFSFDPTEEQKMLVEIIKRYSPGRWSHDADEEGSLLPP
jgi:hypothetical protein